MQAHMAKTQLASPAKQPGKGIWNAAESRLPEELRLFGGEAITSPNGGDKTSKSLGRPNSSKPSNFTGAAGVQFLDIPHPERKSKYSAYIKGKRSKTGEGLNKLKDSIAKLQADSKIVEDVLQIPK